MAGSDFGDILRRWEDHQRGRSRGKPRSQRMLEQYLMDKPPASKEDAESAGDEHSERERAGSVHAKRLPVDADIDLHGLTRAEAESRTDRFIREAHRKGYRKVLVVYGKGLHSREGAVLRKAIHRLLQDHPLTGAMGTPDRKDGGTGAAWVRIRPPSS